MAMADFDVAELMNGVELKNRVVNEKVTITHDRRQYTWEPGETKLLPFAIADWFRNKSLYMFYPGDPLDPEDPARYHYKLVILKRGQDETDLMREDVNRNELLDVENMPQTRIMDPATGKPLRRIYINPRSTGANDAAIRAKEKEVVKGVQSAIVRDAAEKLADAAQGASEDEIQAAVEDLTGVKSARASA